MPRNRAVRLSLDVGTRGIVILATLLGACTGEVLGKNPSASDQPIPGATSGGSPGTAVANHPTCTGEPDVGFAPLARITRTEYNNILRDALGDDSSPASNFVGDDSLGLFEANIGSSVQDTLVSAFMTSAETVSANLVKARLTSLVPCAANQADVACPQTLIETLGRRLYRRPLEPTEVTELNALFSLGAKAAGFAHGAELVLQAMLQSPYFLYHLEVGVGPGPVQALQPFELASRLSFFLWESAPDEALFAAAAGNRLATPSAVEMQARRMLADPRTAAMTRRFYRQWLRVSRLDSLVTDTATATSMANELDSFVDQVTWKEGGTVDALFNSTTAFLDDNTRRLYGVNDPGAAASGTKLYQLDRSQRSGLLTRGPFLAANVTVPARGKFVTNQLLCQPVQDPDPALMVEPLTPDPNAPERDQWHTHETTPVCKGCHGVLDPVGFGFLHYDRAGKYRATDRQFPIDATGTLSTGETGLDGGYDGAIALSQRLAKSHGVLTCLTDIWFTVALDRLTREQDVCAKQQILQAFEKSNGQIPELLVALATSSALSHRRVASQ